MRCMNDMLKFFKNVFQHFLFVCWFFLLQDKAIQDPYDQERTHQALKGNEHRGRETGKIIIIEIEYISEIYCIHRI